MHCEKERNSAVTGIASSEMGGKRTIHFELGIIEHFLESIVNLEFTFLLALLGKAGVTLRSGKTGVIGYPIF